MGEAFTRCSECRHSKKVQWCDQCGSRLRYETIALSYGFGHYRDGDTYLFCSAACYRAWEADEEQQRKRPQRPKAWRGLEYDDNGVDLVCDNCGYHVNTRDFVKLKVEDYMQPYGHHEASDRGLLEVEACPRCGEELDVVWAKKEP